MMTNKFPTSPTVRMMPKATGTRKLVRLWMILSSTLLEKFLLSGSMSVSRRVLFSMTRSVCSLLSVIPYWLVLHLLSSVSLQRRHG